MTDPARFSKEEREQGSKEQEASKKLEENLKKDNEGKPEGPEEAKKQRSEEDPY